MQPLLVVILAAGKGTRMKSALPKVLHALAGRSLLGHAIALSKDAGATKIAVVVGPNMPEVTAEARRHAPEASIFVQHQQLGTANAVLAAREAIASHTGDVCVL
ncbi:MAG: NTP transferase domain-containing protein, partial [Hyphomicrobiaceae bacterium]